MVLNVSLSHLGRVNEPLLDSLPLQAQESKDSSLSLLLSLVFLDQYSLLEREEPPTRDYQTFYLLRLLLLVVGSCVQAQTVE